MSIHQLRCLSLLTLPGLLLLLSACTPIQRTNTGPSQEGLLLHLTITSSRTADQDVHQITLELINTRPQSVTLTAGYWGGPPAAGLTYADFMTSATRFSSYPVLKAESFQIGGHGDLPQPVITLPSGGSTTARWTVTGDTFTGYASLHSLTLPMPGLFLLRAHLPVHVDQQEVDLWSNEAPCSIGGSQEAPRKCSTTISGIINDHTVELSLGTRQGVAPGDRYVARTWDVSLISDIRWKVFEVTAVKEWTSTAVVRDGHPRTADNPAAAAWFPSLGYEVYLIGTRAYR